VKKELGIDKPSALTKEKLTKVAPKNAAPAKSANEAQ
jgi:hypothetical protein